MKNLIESVVIVAVVYLSFAWGYSEGREHQKQNPQTPAYTLAQQVVILQSIANTINQGQTNWTVSVRAGN